MPNKILPLLSLVSALFVYSYDALASASSQATVVKTPGDCLNEQLRADPRGPFVKVYGPDVFNKTSLGTPVTAIDANKMLAPVASSKQYINLEILYQGEEIRAARQIPPRAHNLNSSGHFGAQMAHIDPTKKAFWDYCQSTEIQSVTEIAGGTGSLAYEILQTYKGQYIFNDMMPLNLMRPALDFPKRNDIFLNNQTFPDELKLPDNSQNAIACFHLIHYFEGSKIEASLALILKALKPGGRLFITALSIDGTPFEWCEDYLKAEAKKVKTNSWPTGFNPNQLADSLGSKGFDRKIFPFDQPFIHPLSVAILGQALQKLGFKITEAKSFPVATPEVFEQQFLKRQIELAEAQGMTVDDSFKNKTKEAIKTDSTYQKQLGKFMQSVIGFVA
ncbi:class I SAM-dependent methyltransferase [Candidatus Finniella inopinata]|uniref:class I SAM-dependent methyltransferase n=1 Tax=Candidatus Finniella inopinata TaxID=1696036 RepID=UPI0013EE6688|nr:class I SAM-dependent methyltransferase [Candidatus Finniella inopinata]